MRRQAFRSLTYFSDHDFLICCLLILSIAPAIFTSIGVNAFSSEKLEQLLNQLMKKEFKFIELVGAILGFFIGCIQLGISLFAY